MGKEQHGKRLSVLLFPFAFVMLVWGFVFVNSSDSMFKDPALEEAIREQTGIMDRPIEIADMTNIDRLELRDAGITDLSGIEAATHLRVLDVRDNEIEDISPVQHLISLEELNIRGNAVSDLRPLRTLEELRILNVRENRISDLTPLRVLDRLEDINLRFNEIEDVSPLQDHEQPLVRLYLEGNPIVDTSPLAEIYDDILDPDFPLVKGEVNVSVPGGFHKEAVQVELTSDIEDAEIYYTLDGSTPDIHANRYEAPIEISDRSAEPNDLTTIPINERDDFLQWFPPSGPVFKGTVLRAIAVSDTAESRVTTNSYFIDEAEEDRYPVPVVSISTEEQHLFDQETGLFVNENYTNRGRAWERPVNMEYYSEDGTLAFSQELGMRIHGGSTRHAPIKSLRLYARTDYDFRKDHVAHQFFQDKDQDIFERFLLRYRGTDFKDGMQAHLIKNVTNLDIQYTQPAAVFINGEFWGIYNVRDRFDNNYVKTHYGIEEADIMTELDEVSDGDDQHYQSLLDYLENQADRINEPQVFDMIEARMDVANFRDFNIFQMFILNVDQPGKNLDYWRSRTLNPDEEEKHDGRWRWMVYDLDMGFGNYGGLGIDPFIYQTSQMAFGDEHVMSGEEMHDWEPRLPDFSPVVLSRGPEATFKLRTLLRNDDFRHDFLNRFADLMNTVLHETHVNEVIDDFDSVYRPLVDENANREGVPDDGTYDRNIDTLITFSENRPRIVRQAAIDYFDDVTGTAELTLETDTDRGTIRVNSVVIDAEEDGIQDPAYPWEGIYFSGIPVEIEAIPHDGYNFAGWQGDFEDSDQTLTVTLTPDEILTLEAMFE